MIFISHDSDDHEYALQLAERFGEERISFFIAPESVDGGRDYADEIPKAIKSCEYFVLILSNIAQQSSHVRKELDMAIRYKKRILPLVLTECVLEERYEYLLCQVQIKYCIEDLLSICRLGERAVSMSLGGRENRTINIIKGDFQDNMDYYIDHYPQKLESTVFAIGIDRSSNLELSSNKGILRWVCGHLKSKYGIGVDYLQSLVNSAKMTQLGHKTENEPMRYKESVTIEVPIVISSGEQCVLRLMLIANSQKKSEFSLSGNVDAVEGIDSREIIIEIFNKCRAMGRRAETLFIGAMGTNGLQFPYEVVTAEILNCFVYSNRMLCAPETLFLSVRACDLNNAGLELDEIMSYISTVTSFFRK